MNQWIPLLNVAQPEVVPLSVWENAGYTTLAYALEPLLIKPGVAVLSMQTSLAHYLGWSKQLVLDVRSLNMVNGCCSIRSPFDGSILRFTTDQINTLLMILKPDVVLAGEPLVSVMLQEQAVQGVVTADPLCLALQGQLRDGETMVTIYDPIWRFSTDLLQTGCVCDTCSLGLTRAYLFHLWAQVPGLCQRFLVQHLAVTALA